MIGKTLGHYRIGEQLGRGGMGEVYVADDLNLNRKVALKFLPDAFTGNPERMARFEREAKLLASLNHPNIAAIHGLEEAEGKRFLVLEFVAGETLAQRLSRGPLPAEEALGVCSRIAEGLEAAHEKGVIHRDLKPANVMITTEDKVKILDFGLAKALSGEAQSVDSSKSPTITEVMTQPGVILGTAAYMSPEQAKGKAADKRADVWALGCILYECLTGKRAFEGETLSETLAVILRGEPDWNALPATIPPNVRFVLHRCLEKDVSRRFHDPADVRIQIEEAPAFAESGAGIPVRKLAHKSKIWITAVVLLAAVAAILLVYIFRGAPAVQPMRFTVGMPANISLAVGENSRGCAVISPDGTHLVFTGADAITGKLSLYVRPIESVEVRPLEGTEEASSPFWSADSRSIAFFAHGKLKRVDLKGGAPQVICDSSTTLGAGAWNKDNIIVASLHDRGPLSKVSANGGATTPVTSLKEPEEINHSWPQFLPDGNHFLYFSLGDIAGHNEVRVGSLDSPSAKPVLKGAADPAVYAHPGQLLFLRNNKLWAQPFDTKTLELAGSPVNLAEHAITPVSVSENGTIIYRTDSMVPDRFLWVDWDGREIGPALRPGYYTDPALSPDGSRLAFARRESADSTMDIWILEFAGGALRRFTSDPANDRGPVWSPDGRSIVFWSLRQSGPGLYRKDSSGVGEEELIVPNKNEVWPYQWSPDGRYLLYMEIIRGTLASDAWMFSFADRKSIPLLNSPIPEVDAAVSPDGRWMIYQTSESGRYEIYLTTFPPSSTKLSVVPESGADALWSSDGKKLFYVNATTLELLSLDVKPANPPEFGGRRRIHAGPLFWWSAHSFDVDTKGRRVLVQVSSAPQSDITALLHWTALLKR